MNTKVQSPRLTAATQFYALVQQGKWDEAGQFVTDDFQVIEASDLPFGGTSKGKKAIRSSFEALNRFMNITGIEFHTRLEGDDCLISILDIVVKGDAERELRLSLAEVMRFQDDLISQVQPYYFDHAMVGEAVAAKAATTK